MAAQKFGAAFIQKVNADVEKQVIDRLDSIALAFHREVVIRNPWDLGQSRAGWTFALNRRDETAPARPEPGAAVLPPPPSKPDAWATKIGDLYHVANFVEHTVYLNEGTSVKAPLKYVDSSLQNAVDLFK
jgi:hypothetical protein